MKTLNELLSPVKVLSCSNSFPGPVRKVTNLVSDSRKVREGSVFIALKGSEQDGHDYIKDACGKGCVAIVAENEVKVSDNITFIRVEDSHQAYGQMAAEFFNHPALAMTVIGLTGTNGKTTTSWIIEEMLKAGGKRPGVIGTVNYRYLGLKGGTIVKDAPLTTPEPVMLQQLLREMVDNDVTDVIIEVSSHALDQKRLAGMLFDIGVFTNLSRDHLDYHHTMANYFTAKSKLFLDFLKDDGVAVIVVDSAQKGKDDATPVWGRKLETLLQSGKFVQFQGHRKKNTLITCGFDQKCTVAGNEPLQDINGFASRMTINKKSVDIKSHLIGRHNALNMLAAAGVGHATGMKVETIGQGLCRIINIPGRMERVKLPPYESVAGGPHIFVDYAHTPDALENALGTLRQVATDRLICIFGCGGDRDRGKRPLMGAVAAQLADAVLVTSDNPRTEDPAVIIKEIEKGLRKTGMKRTGVSELLAKKTSNSVYAKLEDRKQAIHTICSCAKKDDAVLVAGKGHETYQISSQGKRFFDDRLEVKNGRMRWNEERIIFATSGKLVSPGREKIYGKVSTDSRTMGPGDVFVALQGDNFDGHDYVEATVKKGAAAVIVSRPLVRTDRKASVIAVDDTLTTLGDLAHYRRKSFAPDVKVIAITGSSGKTTVKDMTAVIFEEALDGSHGDQVLKTEGNLNNLIGLPLSLLKLKAGHRVAVMEMGMNRPGEIERLTGIADPDIGCITNVQAAHLEGLGSIEGVALAKGELFRTMSARSIRVVNYDDPYIKKQGGKYGNNVIGFAVTPMGRRLHPAVRATRIKNLGENGMRFTLHINNWRKRFTTSATGAHNVANSTAAAAVATAAGINPEIIVRGLKRYISGDKRLQISELPGGINVLNDSYNANPSSMEAALRTVSNFGRDCRRIAVLGDMLELGESAAQAHRQIGRLVAELDFDFLAVAGDYASDVALAAQERGMKKNRIMRCQTTEEIEQRISSLISSRKIGRGDWLLLKGSRGMRMERVLLALQRIMKTGRN